MQSSITRIKNQASPIFKKAGVVRSAIFGSVARGEATNKSDIDMLVELPRGRSLLDLMALELLLEKKLGRRVDLLTYDGIHRLLRRHILNKAVTIYEKRS